MAKYQTVRERLAGSEQSALHAYRGLVVGDGGAGHFALYELLTSTVGLVPGGLGLVLRRRLYPHLLGASGRGPILGRSLTIRHPRRPARPASGRMMQTRCLTTVDRYRTV